MRKAFAVLAFVSFFAVGCGEGAFSGCLSPTANNHNQDIDGVPTPTPVPTATPNPCFPTTAPCVDNIQCCSLNCTDGKCL